MSLLSTATVQNDKIVFAQSFESRRYVQDASGVLVGCNVGLRGPGIIPTAASSRVTYDRTQSLLINATQMTIRMALRTSGNGGGPQYCRWLTKIPAAANDNQFDLMIENTGAGMRPYLTIAATAADSANYCYMTGVLTASTDYILHAVYDGSAALGNRVIWYAHGLSAARAIVGTIPASMRAGGTKIGVLNYSNGVGNAPYSNVGPGVLYNARIWGVALSAAEVLDDALNRTYGAP